MLQAIISADKADFNTIDILYNCWRSRFRRFNANVLLWPFLHGNFCIRPSTKGHSRWARKQIPLHILHSHKDRWWIAHLISGSNDFHVDIINWIKFLPFCSPPELCECLSYILIWPAVWSLSRRIISISELYDHSMLLDEDNNSTTKWSHTNGHSVITKTSMNTIINRAVFLCSKVEYFVTICPLHGYIQL